MGVMGHRKRQGIAKAPYAVPCVVGVPNDYHLDMGAPFYMSQPFRPNPTPFGGNIPVMPTTAPAKKYGRINGNPNWYGITPLSMIRSGTG